ncbi:hypothetical protein MASR1M50_15030 [Burkholderiales bacterium]
MRRDWLAQREADDGCLYAAGLLHQAGLLPYPVLWKKARLAMEANRPALARAAVALDAPDAAAELASIAQSAPRYLGGRANTTTHKRQELATLALIRLATQAPDQAAQQLEDKWAALLGREERNWLWGVIGKWSALATVEGRRGRPLRQGHARQGPERRNPGLEGARGAAPGPVAHRAPRD